MGDSLAVLEPGVEVSAGDRESRFGAWVEALDALVHTWIVEDVHWAGADLLAFLDIAGKASGGRLVVATARPSILETAPEWCTGAARLDLGTLAYADAAELVGELVGDALPSDLEIGRASCRERV